MYPIPVAPQGALPRVPPPRHRHGAPSGPWPFVDIDDEVDPARIQDPTSHLPLSASPCSHAIPPTQEFCWCKYPQSLYPNWTPRQQKKSGILSVVEGRKKHASVVYCLDVMRDGIFRERREREFSERTVDRVWAAIREGRPPGVKVRALFAEGLSGPVLQMLGTRYNIEPFFFSSTLGWIPSRFQSHVVPRESDHITIVLTFIRGIPNPTTTASTANTAPTSPNPSFLNLLTRGATPGPSSGQGLGNATNKLPELVIDTQAPLHLSSSDRLLTHDLLAIHMVRSPTSSTIISLHPSFPSHSSPPSHPHPPAHSHLPFPSQSHTPSQSHPHLTTTAAELHTRVHLLGKSVYWANILKDTTDPTFVLLGLLWYGMYAWDEALEGLYEHICYLESQVIDTGDFTLTRELHAIRAHLLHYDSLLQDFRNTILFVKDTPHPGLAGGVRDEEREVAESTSNSELESGSGSVSVSVVEDSDSDSESESDLTSSPSDSTPHLQPRTEEEKKQDSAEQKQKDKSNKHLMDRECGTLLLEVDRLERSRKMMESRVKNVMDLEFSITNIEDSRGMQKLTEATVRDSAAMKQIAYLSMVFLPASFVAAIFGMNVREITGDIQQPETLGHFFAAAVPLTLLTIWIVVGYQIQITERRYRVVGGVEGEEGVDEMGEREDGEEGEGEGEYGVEVVEPAEEDVGGRVDEKTNEKTNGVGTAHRRSHSTAKSRRTGTIDLEVEVEDVSFGFGAAPSPSPLPAPGPGPHSGRTVGHGRNHSHTYSTSMTLRKLNVWDRVWWPVLLVSTLMERRRKRRERMGVGVLMRGGSGGGRQGGGGGGLIG